MAATCHSPRNLRSTTAPAENSRSMLFPRRSVVDQLLVAVGAAAASFFQYLIAVRADQVFLRGRTIAVENAVARDERQRSASSVLDHRIQQRKICRHVAARSFVSPV